MASLFLAAYLWAGAECVSGFRKLFTRGSNFQCVVILEKRDLVVPVVTEPRCHCDGS